MPSIFARGRLLITAACFVGVLAIGNPAWAQTPTFDITLTGQSMIRSDIRVHSPSIVSTMAPLLKGDVVFTNFEAAVGELRMDQLPLTGKLLSPAPPEALDALKALGFNLLSLANNHAGDLKVSGIQNTLREVNRLNLAHAGTGNSLEEAEAPAYLRTPKGVVALVAMASGMIPPDGSATATRPGVNQLHVEAGNIPNEQDAQRILQSIGDASKRADLVIAYQHNHAYDKPFHTLLEEELPERLVPPEWIKKWAHEEVDAGADIVVMHGAPLVQGVEIYRNRPIFYDLGNFIFQLPPTQTVADEPIVWESVIAYVEFKGKNLQSIEFRPIVLNKLGQGQANTREEYSVNLFLETRGLPTPATGDKARYILERLADSSIPFGTTIEVKGDTANINLK
ncbi:MAG: CapA family protein [Candidatus Acidiferrales bacterium]